MASSRRNPEESWRELLLVTAKTDQAGLFWVADIVEDLFGARRWAVMSRLEAELAGSGRLREAFTSFVPMVGDDKALKNRLSALREQIERDIESRDTPG